MIEKAMEKTEELTKAYADNRKVLESRVTRLQGLMDAVQRRLLPGIKSAVSAVNEAKSNLHNHIEANRNLFENPRTRVFHGVKVGLKKGTGSVEFDSPEQVIKLIKAKLPDQVDALIEIEEKLLKKALSNLEASDLKKIGVTVEGTGDFILIKATDGQVDKWVKALLKENKEELEEQREAA